MTLRIAVAGKGGSGKTTFIALVANRLIKKNLYPLLAIDADPNSNLDVLLGLKPTQTIADIRENFKSVSLPPSISKPEYLALQIEQIITEGEKIDLLVMGRPEEADCYCAVNELLRNYLSKISKRYKFVLMDTEAGMEHLSRRTTDDIDHLFILAEPTTVSIDTAERIYSLSNKLKLKIKNKWLIINKLKDKINERLYTLITNWYKDEIFTLPNSEFLASYVEDRKALLKIDENSLHTNEIQKLLSNIENIIMKTLLK